LADLPVSVAEALPQGRIGPWVVESGQGDRGATPYRGSVGERIEHSVEAARVAHGAQCRHGRFATAGIAVMARHRRQCFHTRTRDVRTQLTERERRRFDHEGVVIREQLSCESVHDVGLPGAAGLSSDVGLPGDTGKAGGQQAGTAAHGWMGIVHG
jgi:hypothetical protein